MSNDTQTLAQRLTGGAFTLVETLRVSIQLGDALRRCHDRGQYHGALEPSLVVLGDEGLELLSAEAGAGEAVTPYSAPERLEGHVADARSDIFSFGAVIYEMLGGRRAFEGDTPETLAKSIAESTPAPLGHREMDRLIANCLAKDSALRWQRVPQIVMELKMLAATARRSQNGAAARPQIETVLRAEMERLEARIVSQMAEQARVVAELERSAAEAVSAVREQLGEMDRRFAAEQERAAEETKRELAGLDGAMAGAIHGLEQTVDAQTHAIAAARAGLARTDDLVERVVEALESLQNLVLDGAGARAA